MDGVDGVQGNSEHPWMKLTLAMASENGSFATQKICPERINLVSIVGSKTSASFDDYTEILTKVAKWLEWPLIHEEDDDGNENVVIWPES